MPVGWLTRCVGGFFCHLVQQLATPGERTLQIAGSDQPPDIILPGKLTAEEFAIMKTHAALGRDALICKRVHNAALPHAVACGIIGAGCGSHFDPDLVDAFTTIADGFDRIAQTCRGED